MRASITRAAVLAVAALSLALTAVPAQAMQVYDYVYSGTSFDGTGSEIGQFPTGPNLVGLAYDKQSETLLVAIGGNPGHVSKFTKAGAPADFSALNGGAGASTLVLADDLTEQADIALDNSAQPTAGNIYLHQGGYPVGHTYMGFSPDGSALPGFERHEEFSSGVGVSPTGEIWGTLSGTLRHFNTSGAQLEFFNTGAGAEHPAIDAAGYFYVKKANKKLAKFPPEPVSVGQGPDQREEVYELSPSIDIRGYTVDPSNDHLFAAEGASTVQEYDPAGRKLGGLPAAGAGSKGLAVDPVTHDVWVANRATGKVEKYERVAVPITVPTVTTEAAIESHPSATLQGTINPDGIETTDCYFEYGTTQAFGKKADCVEGPNHAGTGDVAVSAEISGLAKGNKYWYRLVAKNANERLATTGPKRFLGQNKPLLSDTFADEVNTDGAQLNATVDPNGGNTTYRYEYGTEESYGSATPDFSIESLVDAEERSDVITGLASDTTYHYRLIAENEAGTTMSEDHTFTTFAPDPGTDPCPNAHVRQQTGTALLLDCRAYELVSAPNTGGFDVVSDLVTGQEPLISSPSAPDRLLYSVHSGQIPGIAGNPTNYGRDPYVAERSSEGWTTKYVGLPANGMAQVGAFGSPLLETDSALDQFAFGGQGICNPCFAGGSTNIPLRKADGSLIEGMAGSLKPSPINPSGQVEKRFSADGTHLIFGTAAKLESAGKNGFTTIYDRNLQTGATQVVSTLPNGTTIGAGEGLSLDVSADGSRVLIATKVKADAAGNDLHHLYLHLGTNPKSLDLTPGSASGVHYNGMSADGSRLFFTTKDKLLGADTDLSADVYEALVDSEGKLALSLVSVNQSGPSNDDSCEPPGLPEGWNAVPGEEGRCNAVAFAGGAGVAENGAFYFLSPELLDGGHGEADQTNLYLLEPGDEPRFVAVMDSAAGDPGPEEALGVIQTLGPFEKPSKIAPMFVAVDNSGGPSGGDVYVADAATGLVRKYGPGGNLITSWASNGVLSGSTAVDGPFNGGIIGIAVDKDGNLDVMTTDYRTDENGQYPTNAKRRLFQFTEDGAFIQTCCGAGAGNTPAGIAADPTGEYTYAADNYFSSFGRVSRHGANGAFAWIAHKGTSPVDVLATDTLTGDLYVGRRDDSLEVYRFNAEGHVIQPGGGTCLPSTNSGDGNGGCPPTETLGVSYPGLTGLTVDPNTHHLFANLGDEVVELDAAGNEVGNSFGSGFLTGSSAIAINLSSGTFYASDAGGSKGLVKKFGIVPLEWTPIDNPAIVNAVDEAGTHRSSDFQLSTDGRYAAFGSNRSLTGYPNAEHEQVYRFDAQEEQIDCVSCPPTGAVPGTDTQLSPYGRNLAQDGRVFFTSQEPYVLRDTNQDRDAYEFSEGEIQLISTGQSAEGSTLLTVSSDGKDAFFFTRETLVTGDENGSSVKVYTAREDGGFPHDPPPFPCAASDECHGAGTQAPPPPAISTVTGSGRLSGPPKPTKCKKRFVKRGGKCVKRRKANPRQGRRGQRRSEGRR